MVITTFWLKSGDFWPKLAANANKYPNGVPDLLRSVDQKW